MKVTANEAANQAATRVRDSMMILNRPIVINEKQHARMPHISGRYMPYGTRMAAASIGMHSHCMTRIGTT